MNRHNPIELPGLDGQNPLGFLAALGLLRVLDDLAAETEAPRPSLGFTDDAAIHARLWTHLSFEQVQEAVLADASAMKSSIALRLAYDADGALCDPEADGATRDLKASPSAARAYLRSATGASPRDADLAGAFLSELVQDNNGNSKPTSFHFAAGQQAFLSMVEALRVGIDAAAIAEALLGPWRTESALPSLAWDATVARLYALRAADPSKEKRGSVSAANWLGVLGLTFFPVYPVRGRLVTTGVEGGWKDSVFRWPLWVSAAPRPVVASMLRLDWRRYSAVDRNAAGVSAVFGCAILRTDQGGYGSFAPAAVVPPRR